MAHDRKSTVFLPHVNGIRAVAIMGVLIYHLRSGYCPAGYFGVDAFLVISGYFLFRSLLNPEKAGSFRYGHYLQGKAWRILPSWFVCAAAACALSLPLMLPRDALVAANTALTSAFFAADYYVDLCYDYFNDGAHLNPLLHFWYLSLTGQLYIIAPLLLIPLMKLRFRRAAMVLLGGLGLASLAFYLLITCGELSHSQEQEWLGLIGAKTVYYHLVPRFWEIVAGGAILFLPSLQSCGRLRACAGLAGLVGLLLSFFLYATGSSSSYLAVISTMLLVRYGDAGLSACLLAARPVQFLGTISFSLYLWHWPVMVFWKYCCFSGISLWDEAGMLALSLLLGYAAWRLVERWTPPPVDGGWCRRWLVLLTLPAMVALAQAARCHLRPAMADEYHRMALGDVRPSVQDAGLRDHLDTTAMSGHPVYCGGDASVPASFLLMGDSHSQHLYPGLHQACTRQGVRGIFLNFWVVPFWGVYQEGWEPEYERALLGYLEHNPHIRYALISMHWSLRLRKYGASEVENPEQRRQARINGLEKLCSILAEKGVKVILTLDTPHFPGSVSPLEEWQRRERLGMQPGEGRQLSQQEHLARLNTYLPIFRRLQDEGFVHALVDLSAPLMKDGVFPSRVGGEWWYRDGNHMTLKASERAGEHCARELKRIMQQDAALPAPM